MTTVSTQLNVAIADARRQPIAAVFDQLTSMPVDLTQVLAEGGMAQGYSL